MKDVQDIVQKWLVVQPQYDGLVSADGECGCQADDLAPCGDMHGDCEPGHEVRREDGDEDGDWAIRPGPRPKKEED